MSTYTAHTKNIAARPRNKRLRESAAATATTTTVVTPSAEGGITSIGLQFAQDMGFVVSPGTLTSNGTFGVSLGSGREIPLTDRVLHNNGGSDQPRNIVVCSSYPATEDPNTLYIKLEED